MFAMEEYNRYVALQDMADNIWKDEGETPRQAKAQGDANAAYEAYEYAAGIRSWED